MDKDFSLFHLRCCRNDACMKPNWVFLAKEKPQPSGERPSTRNTFEVVLVRGFFYVYDCIICDLQVEIPFDNFTMGMLCILNVAHS